jgi:hypothetical protein
LLLMSPSRLAVVLVYAGAPERLPRFRLLLNAAIRDEWNLQYDAPIHTRPGLNVRRVP